MRRSQKAQIGPKAKGALPEHAMSSTDCLAEISKLTQLRKVEIRFILHLLKSMMVRELAQNGYFHVPILEIRMEKRESGRYGKGPFVAVALSDLLTKEVFD